MRKRRSSSYRKKLDGWKELPNTSVTSQGASGMFSRAGFVVSISAFPAGEPGMLRIALQNHGNVKLSRLPIPPNAKPVYVGDATAMYVTDGAVPAVADAVRKMLLAEGWTPYGSAGDSSYYKQNAVRIGATVFGCACARRQDNDLLYERADVSGSTGPSRCR